MNWNPLQLGKRITALNVEVLEGRERLIDILIDIAMRIHAWFVVASHALFVDRRT